MNIVYARKTKRYPSWASIQTKGFGLTSKDGRLQVYWSTSSYKNGVKLLDQMITLLPLNSELWTQYNLCLSYRRGKTKKGKQHGQDHLVEFILEQNLLNSQTAVSRYWIPSLDDHYDIVTSSTVAKLATSIHT